MTKIKINKRFARELARRRPMVDNRLLSDTPDSACAYYGGIEDHRDVVQPIRVKYQEGERWTVVWSTAGWTFTPRVKALMAAAVARHIRGTTRARPRDVAAILALLPDHEAWRFTREEILLVITHAEATV